MQMWISATNLQKGYFYTIIHTTMPKLRYAGHGAKTYAIKTAIWPVLIRVGSYPKGCDMSPKGGVAGSGGFFCF